MPVHGMMMVRIAVRMPMHEIRPEPVREEIRRLFVQRIGAPFGKCTQGTPTVEGARRRRYGAACRWRKTLAAVELKRGNGWRKSLKTRSGNTSPSARA